MIGGGPAGTSAAITAARLGARVVLSKPENFLARRSVASLFLQSHSTFCAICCERFAEAEPVLRAAPVIDHARLLARQAGRSTALVSIRRLSAFPVTNSTACCGRQPSRQVCTQSVAAKFVRSKATGHFVSNTAKGEIRAHLRDRRRRALVEIQARHSYPRRPQVDRRQGPLSRRHGRLAPPTSTSSITDTAACSPWPTTSSTLARWCAPTAPRAGAKCLRCIPTWPNAAATGRRSRSPSPRRRSSIARLSRSEAISFSSATLRRSSIRSWATASPSPFEVDASPPSNCVPAIDGTSSLADAVAQLPARYYDRQFVPLIRGCLADSHAACRCPQASAGREVCPCSALPGVLPVHHPQDAPRRLREQLSESPALRGCCRVPGKT